MGHKILSFSALIMSFAAAVMLGIRSFVGTNGQATPILFIWLASVAIFLLALRFNITALRHDMAERMAIPNVGLIIVSLYLYFIFAGTLVDGGFPEWITLIVLLGLVVCFGFVFAIYWIRRRRGM